MSWWFSSQQNNSQVNLKKLETFKKTTDVVTFYSYFFSDKIISEYPEDLRSIPIEQLLFKEELDTNPNKVENKILNMYKLLEIDYDNNIKDSNSSDYIINHFKLQIKCRKSYSVYAAIAANNNNYYRCEISKSIYYCLLLLLMFCKIKLDKINILESLIKTYSSKSRKHLDNIYSSLSFQDYFILIKSCFKGEHPVNKLNGNELITKIQTAIGGGKGKKSKTKKLVKKTTTKKPTTKKLVKKTTTKKPTTKKPVKKTTTKKPTTKKPVKKTSTKKPTTKKPVKKTATKKPTTKKTVKKTTKK